MRRFHPKALFALAPLLVAAWSWTGRAAAQAPRAPSPFDPTPAVDALETSLAAIEEAPEEAWRAAALRDALLELVGAARDVAADLGSLDDAEGRREGAGHAAWLLTLALARVDGEAGVSDEAWRDDWTSDPVTTATLYRSLLGARATLLRVAP